MNDIRRISALYTEIVAYKVLSRYMPSSRGERGVGVSQCSVQRGTRKTNAVVNKAGVTSMQSIKDESGYLNNINMGNTEIVATRC